MYLCVMIKIGVSACFFHPDLSRATFGPKTLSYIENDMAAYVARPGVMPILIPELPKAEKLAMIKFSLMWANQFWAFVAVFR